MAETRPNDFPDMILGETRYVLFTTSESKNPGGAGLGRYGPVPEGLVAFLVGMGLLIVVTLWIGARA